MIRKFLGAKKFATEISKTNGFRWLDMVYRDERGEHKSPLLQYEYVAKRLAQFHTVRAVVTALAIIGAVTIVWQQTLSLISLEEGSQFATKHGFWFELIALVVLGFNFVYWNIAYKFIANWEEFMNDWVSLHWQTADCQDQLRFYVEKKSSNML